MPAKADFDSAVEALLALASHCERSAYEEELAAPPEQDDYGQYIIINSVQTMLLPRLLTKLREGEWVASGFGFEGGQPTELDPRLWKRLHINVRMNSTYDSKAGVGSPSATGSFHSLGFRKARKSQAAEELGTKVQTVAKIKTLFERLDKSLPLKEAKKAFFHKADEAFPSVPRAWLKAAWANANIKSMRRRPGLKSN